MNFKKAKTSIEGLTLIELLVVIAIIAILAAMVLPIFETEKGSHQVQCLSNQHQIAIGFIIFEDDHAGRFPAQVAVTNGGAFEIISNGSAAAQFQILSSYLSKRPGLLVCPVDKTRHPAANFSELKNENISYFVNLDAITNVNSILSGDRHLGLGGKTASAGIFVQTTNMPFTWSGGFHGGPGKPYGVLSFGDGHAQVVRATDLNLLLQAQPLETNRFCFP